jgi:DNA-directed RNA polymerase specialized sigma24 family protein
MLCMTKIAGSVAHAYKRLCWWADRDDLEQEALVAMLAAEPLWDPRVAIPKEAFLRKAALRACSSALWRDSAPVGTRSHGREKDLRGLHRAPLSDGLVDPSPGPAEEFEHSRWASDVADRLFRLAMSDDEVGLGLQVILVGIKPALLAERSGLARKEVYRCARKAREAVARDRRLFELWANAPA